MNAGTAGDAGKQSAAIDPMLPVTAVVPVAAVAGALAGRAAIAQRIENPKAVRVTGEQLEGFRLLRGDAPEKHYPAAARRAALEGVVVVDVLLNEVGRVLEAQVVTEAPRNAGFGLAALDTAKTFEFENPLRRWVVLSLTIGFAP